MAKASKLKEFNRGISDYSDGTYFCSNFINTDGRGLSNRLALQYLNKKTASSNLAYFNLINSYCTIMASNGGLYSLYYKPVIIGSTDGLYLTFIIDGSLYVVNSGGFNNVALDCNNNVSCGYGGSILTLLNVKLQNNISSSDTEIKILLTDYNKLVTGDKILITLDSTPEIMTWTTESIDATYATLTVQRGQQYTTASAHQASSNIFIMKGMVSAATTGTVKAITQADQTNFLATSSGLLYSWTAEDLSDLTSKVDLKGYNNIAGMTIFSTATGSKILVGANNGGNGALFIWDGVKTSIDRAFYFNENITALDGEYFALESGIYKTDTYSYSLISVMPDINVLTGQSTNIEFMKVIGDKMFLSNNPYSSFTQLKLFSGTSKQQAISRRQGGLWIYNIEDASFYKIQLPTGGYYDLKYGTPIISNDNEIYFTSSFDTATIYKLNVKSENVYGNRVVFNYLPQSGNIVKNMILKLNVSIDDIITYNTISNLSGRIIVRYYDFKTPFIRFSSVNKVSASDDKDILYLSKQAGTYGIPLVGDKIEIIQRKYTSENNFAGIARNIIKVEEETSYYKCTLDRGLPEHINNNGSPVILNPLKLVKIIELNESALDNNDFYISIEDMPETKKIMIEVEVENDSSNAAIVLNSVEIESNFNSK